MITIAIGALSAAKWINATSTRCTAPRTFFCLVVVEQPLYGTLHLQQILQNYFKYTIKKTLLRTDAPIASRVNGMNAFELSSNESAPADESVSRRSIMIRVDRIVLATSKHDWKCANVITRSQLCCSSAVASATARTIRKFRWSLHRLAVIWSCICWH